MATRADAADILEIYNWYVLNHTATFQVTPSTLEEYEDWVDNTRKVAPLLLARDAEGKLLGYACAHRWHPREAYDWSVESTIYCAPDARGFGVGTLLYRALLDVLDVCGYWNVYALVADPNPASEHIHQRLGFSCVGRTPTRPISGAGWGFRRGGWRCAPAAKSPLPSGSHPPKRPPPS